MGAAATAFILGLIIGPWFIAKLYALKFGQPQRDASEVGKLASLTAHKKGTPAMGGLIIYFSFVGSFVLWGRLNTFTLVALIVFTGLMLVGFLDDWLKVKKRNSDGLAGRLKLLAQLVLAAVSTALLLSDPVIAPKMRELWVPFLKFPVIPDMPWWMVFGLFWLVLTGSSNAVNLTDGVDGLAIGCTITTALAYAVFSYVAGHAVFAGYLNIPFQTGVWELTVVCAILLGSSLAFLWFNAHPARIWMGDTGSLALGGLIGAVSFMVLQPFTLVIVGAVFVAEAASVILQVGYFKYTKKVKPLPDGSGRRIFRKSPVHHHFQEGGWHENQVVIRFWIVSLLCALAGLATLKIR